MTTVNSEDSPQYGSNPFTIHLTDKDRQILKYAREIARTKLVRSGQFFSDPVQVKKYLIDWYLGCEAEEFSVMFLDSKHRLISHESLCTGTINAAPVYPREVVKAAITNNASCVILAHNHPSGDTDPSQADERVTYKLKKALDLIDVNILDHIIVGHPDSGTKSFAECGLL